MYNRTKNSGLITAAAYSDPYKKDGLVDGNNGRYVTSNQGCWGGFGGKVWIVDPEIHLFAMSATNVGNANNDALSNILQQEGYNMLGKS